MDISNHFIEILLSLLTIAFTAWAGIVWGMGRKALDLLSDLKVQLTTLASEQRNLQARVDLHIEKPWHSGAGEELSSLKARVNNLEKHRE